MAPVLDDSRDDCKLNKIYTYSTSFQTNQLSWSARNDRPFRLAVSSFINEYSNKVEVLSLNDEKHVLERTGAFDHPYPATKCMFLPDSSTNNPDLFATTGDYLRVWDMDDTGSSKLRFILNTNKKSDFCAPLTSFDWNSEDHRLIGTSSIDTTCSIWDISTQQLMTQLIAHDKEVYDIAFAKGADIFASVGGDGSLRLFDLRNLEHSTIVYESQDLMPMLKLSWNKLDTNYIATVLLDGSSVVVLDVRIPSIPVAVLKNHTAVVNSVQWAPHSSCHLCTAGEDQQALIWDLSSVPQPVEDPILAYNAEGPINMLQWSAKQNDWIAISYNQQVQILRV